ncbi:MAG: hypothetical protein WBQ17_03345 [Rhizomicrobium sp.]
MKENNREQGKQPSQSTPSLAEIAQLRADRRFPAAAHFLATELAQIYDGDRTLNTLLNNAARLQMSYSCLVLHWSESQGDTYAGLTMSRFKAICKAQRFCSPGRAEATMALMRKFGWIRAVSDPHDRRLKLLVPTEKMTMAHLRLWRRHLEGASMVLADVGDTLAALDRPEFATTFLRRISHDYFRGVRIREAAPDFGKYMDRNNGMVILFSLYGRRTSGKGAADGVIAISVSRLARQFGASRALVRDLLGEAEKDGLVRREGAGGVVLLPPLVDMIESIVACMFLLYRRWGQQVLEEIAES